MPSRQTNRTLLHRLALLVPALALLTRGEAWAYLDPGSVSLFFQALVAAFFGGLLILKRYWHQITEYLRRLVSPTKNDGN